MLTETRLKDGEMRVPGIAAPPVAGAEATLLIRPLLRTGEAIEQDKCAVSAPGFPARVTVERRHAPGPRRSDGHARAGFRASARILGPGPGTGMG